MCSVFMCSTEGGVMCLLVICSIGIGTVVLFMCFYLRLYSRVTQEDHQKIKNQKIKRWIGSMCYV